MRPIRIEDLRCLCGSCCSLCEGLPCLAGDGAAAGHRQDACATVDLFRNLPVRQAGSDRL
jgi:hypothetical protein